jgi:rod shape-determining protein MreD
MVASRLPSIGGLLLALFIVQEAFINRINFFIGGFSLYLAFVIAWVMKEERTTAMLIGFLAGLIADLSPTLEAPFGLWTFTLTGFTYFLVTSIRGSLDSELSPLTMTMVTTVASSVALTLFLLFGAILGQDLATLSVVIREIGGNAMWSLILAPLYIPVALSFRKISLTAREK